MNHQDAAQAPEVKLLVGLHVILALGAIPRVVGTQLLFLAIHVDALVQGQLAVVLGRVDARRRPLDGAPRSCFVVHVVQLVALAPQQRQLVSGAKADGFILFVFTAARRSIRVALVPKKEWNALLLHDGGSAAVGVITSGASIGAIRSSSSSSSII